MIKIHKAKQLLLKDKISFKLELRELAPLLPIMKETIFILKKSKFLCLFAINNWECTWINLKKINFNQSLKRKERNFSITMAKM